MTKFDIDMYNGLSKANLKLLLDDKAFKQITNRKGNEKEKWKVTKEAYNANK